jgi:hypothetical protein
MRCGVLGLLQSCPCYFILGLTRCKRNEEHEDGALGVAVANCRRDRGEPFLWVALKLLLVCLWYTIVWHTNVEFILDDLVVM